MNTKPTARSPKADRWLGNTDTRIQIQQQDCSRLIAGWETHSYTTNTPHVQDHTSMNNNRTNNIIAHHGPVM